MSTRLQPKAQSDIILEFLEIAFNSILYSRKIYPSSVFTQKKKYGVAVRIATHPRISKYILECLRTAKLLMEWDSLRSVSILISSNSKPVERHVFELLPDKNVSDAYFVMAEEAFRVYLLRLSVSGNSLPSLPEDCSFTIELATSAQTSVQLNDTVAQAHFPWLEVEPTSVEPCNNVIVPLKTVETEHLALQMYIECSG